MPFGLGNAPALFERLMDDLLRKLLYFMCLDYLDNIISIAKTFDEMVNNLEVIFSKLRQAISNLTRRSAFFKKEVDCLG